MSAIYILIRNELVNVKQKKEVKLFYIYKLLLLLEFGVFFHKAQTRKLKRSYQKVFCHFPASFNRLKGKLFSSNSKSYLFYRDYSIFYLKRKD